MTNVELVTTADVQLMQGLAQRVTATRLDLVNSDATLGELAWIWGKGHASDGASWPRRLWFSGGVEQPAHPHARGLYYSVGFREFTRDAPLIKTKTAGLKRALTSSFI
jgi:hypothetical protein